MMSRWAVPLDDTNTMLIEFRHVCETDSMTTPEWWADRNIMLPGQLAADFDEVASCTPAITRPRSRSSRSPLMA